MCTHRWCYVVPTCIHCCYVYRDLKHLTKLNAAWCETCYQKNVSCVNFKIYKPDNSKNFRPTLCIEGAHEEAHPPPTPNLAGCIVSNFPFRNPTHSLAYKSSVLFVLSIHSEPYTSCSAQAETSSGRGRSMQYLQHRPHKQNSFYQNPIIRAGGQILTVWPPAGNTTYRYYVELKYHTNGTGLCHF